jgi:nucleotide-binding universal stress UspA family protein
VVRGERQQMPRRIVVGVDSSRAAAAAVDWASEEAERHGADLVVVHAWLPDGDNGRSTRTRDLARADAQCVVDLAVRRCRERTGGVVQGQLVEGCASAALTEASSTADLLVVGSRGRSGFRTMLFGSVAIFVTEHAHCPVSVNHPQVMQRGTKS